MNVLYLLLRRRIKEGFEWEKKTNGIQKRGDDSVNLLDSKMLSYIS